LLAAVETARFIEPPLVDPIMSDDSVPTVAVAGAAGFIGSRVVVELLDAHPDWDVIALDNFYLGDVRQVGDVSVRHVDIRNRSRLEETLSGADVVLHLAAISGVDDCDDNPDLAYEVNVEGTSNVAWFCRQHGAGLVFPFSMAVLGDPETFPITADHPRDPMNVYGRTKLLNERTIETLAEGSFPAHLYLKSNLYGEHAIDGQRVSKGTVINFFIGRAVDSEPLTVYEPGTQSRNYIHVKDVARAYVQSTEALLAQLEAGETGVSHYEIASGEDPSIKEVAELVADAAEGRGFDRPAVELVENPRAGDETLTDQFAVDISKAKSELGWSPEHSVAATVEEVLARRSN
jgi:UDP-glucose 4-epimerase